MITKYREHKKRFIHKFAWNNKRTKMQIASDFIY